jgi:capsular polysaccharide transport system permease protein
VGDMPILLFLLTGVVPFFYFSKVSTSNTNAINANQALLTYRQVKVIDAIISRVILETTLSFASAIICTLIIVYTGQKATLYYPLQAIFAAILLILFATGISLVLAIISYYYIDLNKFIGIVNRILFFTSGVFFSLNDFPPNIAYYLSFNPVLQIIELIRSSFSLQNTSIFLSNEYILISTIISLFFGFICYYVARKSIMMNARAR